MSTDEKIPQAAEEGLAITDIDNGINSPIPNTLFGRVMKFLKDLNYESRGIERVPDDARQGKASTADCIYMAMMWFGINCTANGLNVGFLGPTVYGLGFTDSMLCCTFGTLFGAACTGYIATFGPISGCRTMVISRFTMGWWPSKLTVVLNVVIGLGYGLVNCLSAGLILSAVNGHNMSPIVGIVISAMLTWVVATFGYHWFKNFERFCWIPQVCIFFLLIGCSATNWGVSTVSQSTGSSLIADRISFVFLTASPPLSWASYATDYYIYLPKDTPRIKTFLATFSGIALSKLLVLFLGIGIGSGVLVNSSYAAAFDVSDGALIVEAISPLGRFGKFCAVIMSLGLIANQIPGAYSCSFNFQLLGRYAAKLPRAIWCTISVLIYAVISIAGRQYLLTIFNNFLALIGYWTIIWIAITMEDQLIFRRTKGFNWEDWNSPELLPIGIAAFAAFLVGWVGSVLCMYETYFTGPIAALVGHGADLGLPVGSAWAALAYPPLRYLELRIIER